MYRKLFASILNSSVWSEDSDTCKVWITLIAMSDPKGFIFGSPLGIARIAALPVSAVEGALLKFATPDRLSSDLSREPDREGRRIEIVAGGWRLLNANFYNEIATQEAMRDYERIKKRRQRRGTGKDKSGLSQNVLGSPIGEGDGEGELYQREIETKKKRMKRATTTRISHSVANSGSGDGGEK